jgi:hypothetical protein
MLRKLLVIVQSMNTYVGASDVRALTFVEGQTVVVTIKGVFFLFILSGPVTFLSEVVGFLNLAWAHNSPPLPPDLICIWLDKGRDFQTHALVSMCGPAECRMFTDTRARTPISASGNFVKHFIYGHLAVLYFYSF